MSMIDYTREISKEELATLPVEVMPVPVKVIDLSTSIEDTMEVCQRLSRAEVLGFDTETKPSFTKGEQNKVALLQLADNEGAFLFRLQMMSSEQLMLLKLIMENASIVKAGIAAPDDARALASVYGWHPASLLELRKLTSRKEITVASLSKVYALLFGCRLTKGQRLSNWERENLTEGQIHYAGLDAWAGLRIYNALSDLYSVDLLSGGDAASSPSSRLKNSEPTAMRSKRIGRGRKRRVAADGTEL